MFLVRLFYTYMLRRTPPYYTRYPFWLILWKPIRKFINVVVIPAIPYNTLRILLYRAIGFKIGKNVFIGMKCYLDDMDPSLTTIGDNVTISYGCYFACHGKNQAHTPILIEEGAYIGMRCSVLSGRSGLVIGRRAIIGAASLVNRSIPSGATAYGVPAKSATGSESL